MPLSPLMESTLHTALLSGVSNVMAQVISAKKEEVDVKIDFIPVFQFVLLALVTTPPNFLWQEFLESTFPAHEKPPHPKKSDDKPPPPKLSIRNTLIKFLLDQTLGAGVNTILFSIFNRSLQAAMSGAPRVTNFRAATNYWTSPMAIDFSKVNFDTVWWQAKGEFWEILTAGWKFWPLISAVNYTMVKTVQMRGLVGSFAGVLWGVYMSLVAAR